jgi:hypothetical protein
MAGRPVIISDQTPWRNLEEKHAGWDLSLDNNAVFAATISRLAAFEQKEYNRLCMAAWNLGEDHSDNSALLENYITMFS